VSQSYRNPVDQSSYDRLVAMLARSYRSRRYSVSADIQGFPRPRLIGGYRPDVIAVKGSYVTIVEVETPDTVDSDHARAQEIAFRRACRRNRNWHIVRRVARN